MAKALITAYDLLAPAGEPATLQVEVERRLAPFLDPAKAGVEVEVEGHGRAATGPDGLAAVPLGVLPEGTHRLEVRCGSASAEALVRVLPRDARIFITDVDHTIADVSPVGFIFKPLRHVWPVAGSPEALQEIARAMQVVYLTARDHIYTRKTKDWLRLRRFPEGPVYLRSGTRFWSAKPRSHKIARLGEIRPLFTRLDWGVGDTPGDIAAYDAHGIRPILLAARPWFPLPASALHAPDWTSILDVIRKSDRIK